MQSKAATVEQYLAELPEDRRAAIAAVRQVILDNLDDKYEEGMQYGMIGYYVPHRIFPAGYHCDPKQPLPFAGLASQKNHMALYIMGPYADPSGEMAFRRKWLATGKKLDMGKCCVRFKKLDDVALDVVAETFKAYPADEYIKHYESAILTMNKQAAARREARAGAKAAATAKSAPPKASAKTSKKTSKKVDKTPAKTAAKKPATKAVKKSAKKSAR